jgi:hypothetical protein
MPTVLENYQIAVRVSHPNARLTTPRVDGHPMYQIMDGNEALSDREVSPTIAWREADYRLANPPL